MNKPWARIPWPIGSAAQREMDFAWSSRGRPFSLRRIKLWYFPGLLLSMPAETSTWHVEVATVPKQPGYQGFLMNDGYRRKKYLGIYFQSVWYQIRLRWVWKFPHEQVFELPLSLRHISTRATEAISHRKNVFQELWAGFYWLLRHISGNNRWDAVLACRQSPGSMRGSGGGKTLVLLWKTLGFRGSGFSPAAGQKTVAPIEEENLTA